MPWVLAWHNRCFFCCTAYCDRSMILIQGNFKPYCHVSVLSAFADMLFMSITAKLWNCVWLQNALERRVPITVRPVNRDDAPTSQTGLSLHAPITCDAWLTVHPRKKRRVCVRGVFSCATSDHQHAQVLFVLVQLGRCTHLIHPPPFKKHLIMLLP